MKVAMIGAGSVVFANRLLTDILTFPELQNSTIALMDIDAERLDLTTRCAEKLVAQEELPAQIQATTDRREALDGADYVIIMILVGGVQAERLDIEIANRFGVTQAVGDTLGTGGVVRFLRTAPVLLDICRDIEELCPNALLLNYTNPMAMNCWLMNAATAVKNVGLCHSVQGTARQLAGYMNVDPDEITYWTAGINHMAWYLELAWRGEDAYPMLWEALETSEIYAKDAVRFEIMRHFDYFVTESSRHMSEYVPYFRANRERMQEFGLPPARDMAARERRQTDHFAEMTAILDNNTPSPFSRSREYGSRILYAMETNTPYRMNGNVNNTGLITNLPAGTCVEVPCLVDGTGIHPCHVGDLPPQLAGLNRTNINVQELAVKSALEEDAGSAVQAMALDPLTASLLSLADIRRLADELLSASSPWLPVKLATRAIV